MQQQNKLMKIMGKIIASLVLLLVFLVSCFGIIVILFTAAWFHTYNAFTSKELIAEIEVTPLEQDINGFEKFKVKYKQYQSESALMKFIFPNNDGSSNKEVTLSEYEMYGDTILIEAHIVKLPDFLTLLNFKAIYKITGIEGDFVNDKSKAKSLPSNQRSLYDLNGGVDDVWKWIKENELNLTFIIDTAEISKKGKNIGSSIQKWGIYITEEGITIDTLK